MSPTGHLAIGFAAKKFAPQVPVIVILIAAYIIDLIYFILLAAGIENANHDPWSHSLFMAIIWSIIAGLITLILSRKYRSGLIIGLVVFSHWILDFIVWDNLTIFFDETHKIGLGLYNRIGFSLTGFKLDSGTIIATLIELGMLIISLAIYNLYRKKLRNDKMVTKMYENNNDLPLNTTK
ncbi:MAG: metal-dependent hydrolase [Saccharofermentanales bacterium]